MLDISSMKILVNIFLFIALVSISRPVAAAESSYELNLLCAYDTGMYYQEIVKFKNKARDKFRHCAISCIIGIECGIPSSAVIGVAKEVYDIFGDGQADWGDLMANILGIRISRRAGVSDLESCRGACEQFYPGIIQLKTTL